MVQTYEYIAMDTEFPGVVARPMGEFKSSTDYHYQLLRCNVDLLKIIQLGVTFMDSEGNLPEGITTWQFNFKFSLTEDMYAEDSIELLQNSGIQFEMHEQDGIDTMHFAEMMIISGLVLMENVRWISFHSHYDFGYLIALLTSRNLPQSEAEFFEVLKIYFPNVYDVKYLMNSCKNLIGGLQQVADTLGICRVGRQHQAGSDALLTGQAFFRMQEIYFDDDIDDSKYCGHLFGLGTAHVLAPAFSKQSTPVAATSDGTSQASTSTTTKTTSDSSSTTSTRESSKENSDTKNDRSQKSDQNIPESEKTSPVDPTITSSLSAILSSGSDSVIGSSGTPTRPSGSNRSSGETQPSSNEG